MEVWDYLIFMIHGDKERQITRSVEYSFTVEKIMCLQKFQQSFKDYSRNEDKTSVSDYLILYQIR